MDNSNVTLIQDAIGGVLSEDDCPVHSATLARAARAALGALAGAERLRADDSDVEVQLQAPPRPIPCGRPWVAEIALCPRCRLGADRH